MLLSCVTTENSQISNAAVTPLNDLNLIQVEIPTILLEAESVPYRVPDDLSCLVLNNLIVALDLVLEPDLDVVLDKEKIDILERGSAAISYTAVGSFRSTVESLVPFRSWVRKLSGAERHSKLVEAAINAGVVRRAFLKELKAAKVC